MTVDASLALSFAPPVLVAVSVNLAGRRDRPDLVQWGWALGFLVQVVQAVYALVTRDWGWLLGLVIVAPFFARNWLRGRRPPPPTRTAVDGTVTVPWTEWSRVCARLGVDPRTGDPA